MERVTSIKITADELNALATAGSIIAEMCSIAVPSTAVTENRCKNCEFKGLCDLAVNENLNDLRIQIATEFDTALVVEEE